MATVAIGQKSAVHKKERDMFEILAAAGDVTGPSALQTWGPWGAVVVALGGPKGVAMILSMMGKGGNGNGKYNEEACKLRHEALEKTQKKNDENYTYIRDRLDEIARHLFGDKHP